MKRMKKQEIRLLFALVCVILLMLFCGSAMGEQWSCGENVTATLDGETLTISGTGLMTDYSDSGESWLSDCYDEVESIVIKEGVTSIGNYSFYCFEKVSSVTIPSSVTSIGKGAFHACEALKNITIPSSVTSIGADSFAGCRSLGSVIFEEKSKLLSIGDRAFANCGFSGIILPASLTSIGDCIFFRSSLTSISVEEGNTVFSAKDGVLYNADQTALLAYPPGKSGEFVIPSNVTSIGSRAFYYCKNLNTILAFPVAPPTLGNYAFSDVSANFYVRSADYKTVAGWKDYSDKMTVICTADAEEGITVSGTAAITADKVNYYTENTQITLSGYEEDDNFLGYVVKDGSGNDISSTVLNGTTLTMPAKDVKISAKLKEAPSITTAPAASAITYGQTLKDSTLSGGKAKLGETEVAGKFTWKDDTVRPAVSDSGKTDYSVVFTPEDTTNYTTAETTITLTVNPKEVTATVTANDRNYQAENKEVSLTAGTVSNVETGDTVTVDVSEAKGEMADDTAGTGKAVAVNGVKLSGTHAGNYKLSAQPSGVTVNISKVNQTVTPDAPKEKSKTSTSVTLEKTDGYQYSKDGTNWQDSNIFDNLTASTGYTFYQRVAGDDNHNPSPASSGKVISTTQYTLVYNPGEGTGTMAPVGVSDNDTYKFPACDFYAPEYKTFDHWKMSGADGIFDPDDTNHNTITIAGNCADEDGVIIVTAHWKYTNSAVVTVAPAAKTLTYNGQPQELITAGEADGGTMQYALGTATEATEQYTTSIPAKTDAGTYYVWYKAVGDKSHSDSDAGCCEAKIGKAEDPAVITGTATVTVGGNTVDLSEKVTGAVGEVSYAFEEGEANGCSLEGSKLTSGDQTGTSKVKVTVKESANYTGKTGTIAVTVTDKATGDLEVKQAGAVYGETLADPEYTRPAKPVKDAVISYSGTTNAGATYGPDSKKPTEAGSYTVSVTDETIDTIYSGSAKFTISKADPDVTAPSGKENLEYNGSAQELVTAGTTSGGTMQYALTDTIEPPTDEKAWSADVPTGKDAKDYYVWYRVAGGDNYNDYGPYLEPVIITKRAVTITAKAARKEYGEKDPAFDDAEMTGQVSGELTDLPLAVTRSDAGNDDPGVHRGVLTIGKTKEELDRAYPNYTFTVVPADFTIAESGSLTVSAESVKVTYDGKAHGVSAAANIEGATVRYWNEATEAYDLETSPSWSEYTNGAKTVKFRANLKGYEDATGEATVTVEAREISITAKPQTINEGESIATGAEQAELSGAAEGHTLSAVTLAADSTDTKIIPKDGVIVDAAGKETTANYKITYVTGVLTVKKIDPPEPVVPTVSGNMDLKLVSKGKTALRLTWKEIDLVEGYDIYIAPCGTDDFRLAGTVGANEEKLKDIKQLSKDTAYKVYISAFVEVNKEKHVVMTSDQVHCCTGTNNGSVTNPKGISVKSETMTLNVGQSGKIGAKAEGKVKGMKVLNHGGALRYRSTNPAVATVTEDGKVTGVSEGVCQIILTTSNGLHKTVRVTVSDSMKFKKKSYTVKEGKKIDLTEELELDPEDIGRKLIWTSSDKEIAKVNRKGEVTGRRHGTVTITVVTKDGKAAEVRVRVK